MSGDNSVQAEQLDAFLREVVRTLHTATAQGLRHAQDDPAATRRAIGDCQEILDQIMAGDVEAWVA